MRAYDCGLNLSQQACKSGQLSEPPMGWELGWRGARGKDPLAEYTRLNLTSEKRVRRLDPADRSR